MTWKATPPRVAVIVEATDAGTGRHVLETSRAMAERGVEVHVVYSNRRSVDFEERLLALATSGVRSHALPMHRAVRPVADSLAVRRLRRLLREVQPAIVHGHGSKGGAIARLAGRRDPAVVIYTPHAFSFLDRRRWRSYFYRFLERRLSRWTDHFVAVSNSERVVAIEEGVAVAETVTVIENGVDLADPCKSEFRNRDGDDRLRIGFFGRLEPQKNPIDALRLATELLRRERRFVLVLAGEGTLRSACRRHVESAGLGGRVQFLGRVSEPSDFYRDIDVYLTTSLYEGLSYGVLDAMAREIPVVGYDVVGVRDAVIDGETGHLVETGDLVALADRVTELHDDQDRRHRFGRAARRRVRAVFGLERQGDDLARLYTSLLRDREA